MKNNNERPFGFESRGWMPEKDGEGHFRPHVDWDKVRKENPEPGSFSHFIKTNPVYVRTFMFLAGLASGLILAGVLIGTGIF